jgi:hypothetical protein
VFQRPLNVFLTAGGLLMEVRVTEQPVDGEAGHVRLRSPKMNTRGPPEAGDKPTSVEERDLWRIIVRRGSGAFLMG